jgi:hypothetical protein
VLADPPNFQHLLPSSELALTYRTLSRHRMVERVRAVGPVLFPQIETTQSRIPEKDYSRRTEMERE